MLDTVGAPLAFGDLGKDGGALVQDLVNDSVLGVVFEILKSMLNVD